MRSLTERTDSLHAYEWLRGTILRIPYVKFAIGLLLAVYFVGALWAAVTSMRGLAARFWGVVALVAIPANMRWFLRQWRIVRESIGFALLPHWAIWVRSPESWNPSFPNSVSGVHAFTVVTGGGGHCAVWEIERGAKFATIGWIVC